MNKLVRTVLASALALTSAAGLASCGTQETDTANGGTDDKLKVGVILQIENGAFTDMKDGFIQELRDKGYSEDKLEIDYKCAQGDSSNLNTIVQDMINSDKDLIATVGTPASQAVVGAGSDIPNIFISVGDPVGQTKPKYRRRNTRL